MDDGSSKLIQFNGTAGGTFVATLVYVLLIYIPIIGLAFGFNFFASWVADNTLVNGRAVKFNATFGETFVFFLVNILLLIITLGIYVFWYLPKYYRFIVDHVVPVQELPVVQSPPINNIA